MKIYILFALYTLTVSYRHQVDFEVCLLNSARPSNASYISHAIVSLITEGVDPRDITVIDTDNSAQFLHHVKLPQIQRNTQDCVDDGKDVEAGLPCKVFQSNFDVMKALETCHRIVVAAAKKWILFLEDDVEACLGSINTVSKVLHHADPQSIIRFSKFSRAFALSIYSTDPLIREIDKNVETTPYDIVLWGNKPVTHPSNLFHHVGEVSTISYRNKREYRLAYDAMRSDFCGERLL